MADEIIRPDNGLLLVALQANEDTPATLSAATDAVSIEAGSISFNSPFTTEDVNEVNGSMVGGAAMVIGQPATVSFRTRLRGAGAAYTPTVKPPLHATLAACGMRPRFFAATSPVALAAGTATSATLGATASTTPQDYVGMPLILSGAGAPGTGHMPYVTDYTAARVTTLSDLFNPALSAATAAEIPGNWTYAGTSPRDAASRLVDTPLATIEWYEDGVRHRWIKCRGVPTFSGQSARAGMAAFAFTGVYAGKIDAAIPANPVLVSIAAPQLVKGAGAPPAILLNRRGLPISTWQLAMGALVESPDDPNTDYGFGSAQIGRRKPMLTCDPLASLVATRDTVAQMGAGTIQPGVLRFGTQAGNRIGLLMSTLQVVKSEPGMRGDKRSEDLGMQALSVGRDAVDRDRDVQLTFS